MPTSRKTVDYIVEQIAGAALVTAKPMFGEYGLYCDGKMIAIIGEERLFIKLTAGGRALAENARGCCQSKANLSPAGRRSPKPEEGLSRDCPPGSQCGVPSLLVDFAADEVSLLIEVVVHRAVHRGEGLECFHPPKPEHGPFSSSERLV